MAPQTIPIRRSLSAGSAAPRPLRPVQSPVVHYSPAARSSAGGITAMASSAMDPLRIDHPGVCDRDQHGHSNHRRPQSCLRRTAATAPSNAGVKTVTVNSAMAHDRSNIPVRVRAINAPTRLVAGYEHTCALFSGGVMRCWGQDNYGQLGNRRKNECRQPVARHRRRHARCGVAKQ